MLKRRRDPAAVNSRLIRRPIQRMFWLFLLPMTGAFCIGFVYPFLKGLFLSFCKFKTTSKWTWVGLANYGKAFADESFRYSFGYTAIFAIVSLIIINVLAFAVAYALTQGIKGTNVFRTVFFMPNLIGGIVLGYIWSMIFDGVLSHYGTSILPKSSRKFSLLPPRNRTPLGFLSRHSCAARRTSLSSSSMKSATTGWSVSAKSD